MALPLVDTELAAADTDTCNVSNGPAGDTVAGGMIAACFTPPSYPARLRAARFYVPDLGAPTTKFGVRVFRADGQQGAPGSEIATSGLEGAAQAGDQWATVDLDNAAIEIASGDFCVAMSWLTPFGANPATPEAQALCGETGAPTHDRSFIRWASPATWRRFQDIGAKQPLDVLIRVTVASPATGG